MALVVKSAVKDVLKEVRVGGDFLDALEKAVEGLVKKAAERAKANGRKTVKACDL